MCVLEVYSFIIYWLFDLVGYLIFMCVIVFIDKFKVNGVDLRSFLFK